MHYLYLLLTPFTMASCSIFGGFFNQKTKKCHDITPLYDVLFCFSSFVGWVILFLFDRTASLAVLPYAIGFGTCYAVFEIGFLNALKTGPVSLTTLLVNMALIASVIWGFFFWDSPFTPIVGAGLVLVAVSLTLCLYQKADKTKDAANVSVKWIFFVLLSFLGNAGCAIIQKTQQLAFDGQHGSFMMMCAIFFSTAVLFVRYLKSDKSDTKQALRRAAPFPVASGLCNALHNLLIILLATAPISSSLVYPFIALGGLSVSTLFSLLIFKEKLRPMQWVGMAVGALAILLLSL